MTRSEIRHDETRALNPDSSQRLLALARAGDLLGAIEQVHAGAALEAADELGRTALVTAIQAGHAALAGFLIEAGADPNARHVRPTVDAVDDAEGPADGDDLPIARPMDHGWIVDGAGETPLSAAIEADQPDVVERLLAAGADPDPPTWDDTGLLGRAAAAGQLQIVARLIEAGASLRGGLDRSPLEMAARAGQRDVVERLLHAGADANEVGPDGWTAIQHAAELGHAEVVDLLAPCSDAPYVRAAEQTLLSLETRRLETREIHTREMLEATLAGDLERLRTALSHGASPDDIGSDGLAALHLAARRADGRLLGELLDAGGDPDVRRIGEGAEGGVTPLMMVAAADVAGTQASIAIRLLARRGADVNGRDDLGRTALHHALQTGPGHLAAVEMLLAAGAEVGAQDSDGNSALMVLEWRRDALADVDRLRRLLLDAGAGSDGLAAVSLLAAARAGNVGAIRLQLKSGASVDHRLLGQTPLGLAACHGRLEAVLLLLAAGADPQRRGLPGGPTALIHAAASGQREAVRQLHAAGADLHATGPQGNALDVAIARRHHRVVAYLRARGVNRERF